MTTSQKVSLRSRAFNPHAHAAQNYSIVEDLAQAPSVMSALEVLQSCPAQRRDLLKAIGGIDPTDSNLIVFDLDDHIPRLPPQLVISDTGCGHRQEHLSNGC
jgi:hypothetical protein